MTRSLIGRAFRDGAIPLCPYCGEVMRHPTTRIASRLRTATVDHMIPTSRGGTNHAHNLTVCCWYCNHIKSWLTADEFTTVIHDGRARRALLNATRPGSVDPPTTAEERFQRRYEKLTPRLRDPNPDCSTCGGTGIYSKRHREHVCRCALIPLTAEESAAHINARRQDRARASVAEP